ncbi:MAG: sigma-70 family RNA polymerase sigma factor [Planctomycetota bacterium]
MRSLARGLLSDRATADDIVQDTWVAALERPPSPRKLRAWLAAVVCNSARLQLRARARRTSREQRFASRERLPSTDEIVQHEAERRRVVGIVLAITEPHRSTLLLRYWCDLSPGAIAERLGIPHSTVRNRLKRALEQVRTRLDRESGGMQRAVRVLLALPVPAIGTFAGPSATASIGVLAMSAKLKMAWACLVLAVAGGFTWMLASRPDRNARPAATTARHERLPPPPSPAQEQRADVPARAAAGRHGCRSSSEHRRQR